MHTNTNNHEQGEIPARGDGGTWKSQMLAVAQLRALGKSWPDCAASVGLKAATIRQYPCRYPGWGALEEHYRKQAFDDGVKEHFMAGSVEALDALRQEFRSAAADLKRLEERAEDGELDPSEAAAAVDLSRAVAYAADKYLKAIGFQRYRHRLAEMQAEEEVQGQVGQTVHVSGVATASELVDDLAEMTPEEKAAAFKDLVGDGRE